jgi:serine/threonine protein phosphatase 1
MAGRTIAIGDLHGDLQQLLILLSRLPALDADDTLVFLGDYVDRGPDSRGTVDFVSRELPQRIPARIVALAGNHEDAWIRVVDGGWPEFLGPPGNGVLQCYRSYIGAPQPEPGETMTEPEYHAMARGAFFPPEHVAWFRSLPTWYEDEHAIYVHAGLPQMNGRFVHPSEANPVAALLWVREEVFFREYRGKHVVIGHTTTNELPQELSKYTPADPNDLWAGDYVTALDTGCGKPGGFLTAFELPARYVYEAR